MVTIYAIEGIVHSGKSSLLNRLSRLSTFKNFEFVQEYSEFVGGKNFPGFPKNSLGALKANEFFGELEEKRFLGITGLTDKVMLDRSLFSVLAYHYATERISRGEIKCFDQSIDFFQKFYGMFFPNVCIHLVISFEEMMRRHKSDGYYEPKIMMREFNKYLLDFYEWAPSIFPNTEFHKIDGTKKPEEIIREVQAVV